jgi:hypothetical protein
MIDALAEVSWRLPAVVLALAAGGLVVRRIAGSTGAVVGMVMIWLALAIITVWTTLNLIEALTLFGT